jgi:hypothetical protein
MARALLVSLYRLFQLTLVFESIAHVVVGLSIIRLDG